MKLLYHMHICRTIPPSDIACYVAGGLTCKKKGKKKKYTSSCAHKVRNTTSNHCVFSLEMQFAFFFHVKSLQ